MGCSVAITGASGYMGRALTDRSLLVLAGGLSSLGFAPLDWWPLPLLALALLLDRAAAAKRMRDAALAGWVFGVGHFVVGLNWIATAFTYQDNMPAWLGWAAVLVLSLYMALFPALTAALAWRVARGHRLAFVLVFAAGWMGFEWLRSTLFTGFAWNPLAMAWLALPWVAQGASWIGTYGLSGLAVLVGGLLWIAAYTRGRTAALATAATLATAAIVMLLGHSLAAGPWPEGPGADGIPFRVVQPNIGQDEKYNPDQAERNTRRYAQLSGSPVSAPRLLLWPEGATLRFLDIEPDARAELAGLIGPRDLLLMGGESIELDLHGSNDVYHNSVFALGRDGGIRWRYDKAHLVPFGEYLPAREILSRIGLSRLVPGDGDFSRGPGPRSFPLPGFTVRGATATVGVQLCYEIIFSGHVVDEAHRPAFLFNPSNDAWFGAWGPPQHLAQARMRAIEEGIPIIRATTNGISALIGPTGRLLASVPTHRANAMDGFIPPALPPTLFARMGLWASALFGACLAAIGLGLARVKRPLTALTT